MTFYPPIIYRTSTINLSKHGDHPTDRAVSARSGLIFENKET